MNTPNKLTIARIIMSPLFLVTLALNFKYHYFVSAVIFIAASITDYIDGNMARKYNLVTSFGKFMDPLADKMLTTAAFLYFVLIDNCYGMVFANFIILSREFLVTSVRYMTALSGGKVVAANIWGKLKTVMQMVAIIMTLIFEGAMEIEAIGSIEILCSVLIILMNVAIWLSVAFTVLSGIIYAAQNREYISLKKQ